MRIRFPTAIALTTLPNERTFTIISGEELVYEDGAAMLPDGDQRFETNLGDELRVGQHRTGDAGRHGVGGPERRRRSRTTDEPVDGEPGIAGVDGEAAGGDVDGTLATVDDVW